MSLYTMTFDSSEVSTSSPSPPPQNPPLHIPNSPSIPREDPSDTDSLSSSTFDNSTQRPPIPHPQNRRQVTVHFSSSSGTSDDEISNLEMSPMNDSQPPDFIPPPETNPPPAESSLPSPKTKDLFSNLTFRGITDSHLIAHLNSQIQRLPHAVKPTNLIPYKVFRTQKLTLKGQRTKFSLFQDGALILFSKIKARSMTEIVHISKAKESFHFSGESFEAALLAGNGFKSFSLRLRNQFGPELIILRFEHPLFVRAPRVVRVMLFNQSEGIPDELTSKPPIITTVGTWMLDLCGRLGKRSIKNCILIDIEGREFMSLMKIKKSEFVVESHPGISELCVFALAISSCLCKM
jgi:hypothetical protein